MSKKLYVSVDGDHVKVCHESGEIRETGLTALEFVARFNVGLPRYTAVYIEGSKKNAELLANLGAKLLRTGFANLHVCAPANVVGEDELKRLWLDAQSRRRRTFYPLCGPDVVNYDLIGCYHTIGMHDMLADMYHGHPTYVVRRFCPFGDIESTLKLIMQVVDPRWHINVSRPNRFNRLFQKLNLTPENFVRDAPVVRSWWGGMVLQEAAGEEYFFHWHYFNHFAVSEDTDTRLLKTSKLFVEFLCRVWLDILRSAHGQRPVFDPEMFFKSSVAAQRYLVVSESK